MVRICCDGTDSAAVGRVDDVRLACAWLGEVNRFAWVVVDDPLTGARLCRGHINMMGHWCGRCGGNRVGVAGIIMRAGGVRVPVVLGMLVERWDRSSGVYGVLR